MESAKGLDSDPTHTLSPTCELFLDIGERDSIDDMLVDTVSHYSIRTITVPEILTNSFSYSLFHSRANYIQRIAAT